MITKENIMITIHDIEENLMILKKEEINNYPDVVKKLIHNEIGNVEDNLYRYKMQAKAWGLLK